jgi:hypothetical protein
MPPTLTALSKRLETGDDAALETTRDDLPRRRATIERGRLRRWRRWSGDYAVCAVQPGATVAAGHNVATIYRKGRVRAIDVSGALGIAPDQVLKVLVRKPGEQVVEGDLLAEQRLFLGGRKRRIFSPAGGQLLYASTSSGLAYVSGPPSEAQVLAHVGGQVVTVGADSVLVEGNAIAIAGVAGAGRAVGGRLLVVTLPRDLPPDLTGSVVACAFPLDEATARNISSRGAVGVIAAGIESHAMMRLGWDEVLWPLVRPRFGGPSNDPSPPITIVLLSVANDEAPEEIWRRIAALNGRPVSLLGREPGAPPELVATLDGPSGGTPAHVTLEGMRSIRLRSGPGAGRVVKVEGLLPFPVQLPSEIEVQAARLDELDEYCPTGTQPLVACRDVQSLSTEP